MLSHSKVHFFRFFHRNARLPNVAILKIYFGRADKLQRNWHFRTAEKSGFWLAGIWQKPSFMASSRESSQEIGGIFTRIERKTTDVFFRLPIQVHSFTIIGPQPTENNCFFLDLMFGGTMKHNISRMSHIFRYFLTIISFPSCLPRLSPLAGLSSLLDTLNRRHFNEIGRSLQSLLVASDQYPE